MTISKQDVLHYYENHKKITSPIFWVVKVTPYTLEHLDKRDRNHRRSDNDRLMRYRCFLYIAHIIEKSHFYQEWKIWEWHEYVKIQWKKKRMNMSVQYYGIVSIVEEKKWYKTRIKVVLKKVRWWNHAEVVSVIPARNAKWYTKMFFEETKKPN